MSEFDIEVVVHQDSEFAYARKIGAVITTGNAPREKDGTSIAVVKNSNGSNIAEWGSEGYNLFPNDVIKDVKKSVELSTGLSFYTMSLVGSGLCYGYIRLDEEGEERPIRVFEPEIEAFFRANQIVEQYTNIAYNYKSFWNVFNEIVLDRSRTKIVAIKNHKSHHCRFEKMNENTGIIRNVLLNADWENYKPDYTTSIPLIDKSFMPVETLRARKDSIRYMYTFAGPGTDIYYQTAPWNSVRESGWLPYLSTIPKFKLAIMKNQMLLRYHVQIPDYYWTDKYPTWQTEPLKRKDWKKETYDSIVKFLSGADNAGKSLFTGFKFDEQLKKELPGVIITPINNQTFSGEFLQDSAEGSQKVYHALEIDSTLLGTLPGKGQSAGSGSDKSVAWNLHMAKTRGDQQIQLQLLDFIAEYNGWHKKYEDRGGLRFWYKNDYMARLMDVPPAKREAKQQ